MRVTVAPYKEFAKAVYIDGEVVKSQTLEDPIELIDAVCFTALTDEKIKHRCTGVPDELLIHKHINRNHDVEATFFMLKRC